MSSRDRASRLRVLTIAHNAVAESNRRRHAALGMLHNVEVGLLTPRWWFEEGRRIEVPAAAPWQVGRTVGTGNGTRHLYVGGLVKALRTWRPEVIDLYEEPFSLVALQTLLLRDVLAPRAALVFYSAVNVERRWRWPYRTIERLVLRRADGAYAPNRDVPPILRARGMTTQPVSVIPLGVDVERFSGAEPMQLPDIPTPRIGFVGRLEPVKGLDVLLDAFEGLTTPASLVIAGDGSQRQTVLARINSMPARAAFLLPPVSYEVMPAFLKSLDVLVLPSVTILPLHREQFGRVLAEAMAAGVPVVGSSSGAIPEVIGEAGLVVRERDAAGLARAIERVFTQPELRRSLVERGRQRASEHFAWTVVADQTLQLFRSAVEHRRRATASLGMVRA